MSELDAFLTWLHTRQRDAELAILNGDAGPRLETWGRDEPVTLFGAWWTATDRDGVERTFQRLAEVFSQYESYEREIIAAGVSGDLAYTVSNDRIATSVNGAPSPHVLRVTQVYRREDGEWKVVHRHADPPPEPDKAPAAE